MTVTARMRRPDAPVRAWRDRASRRGPWSFHLSSSCSTSSRVRLFCGMRELGKLPQALGSCGEQELIVSSSQIQTSTMRVCSSPRSRRAASERLPSRNLPKSPRRRRRCLLKRMQSRRSSCRVRTKQRAPERRHCCGGQGNHCQSVKAAAWIQRIHLAGRDAKGFTWQASGFNTGRRGATRRRPRLQNALGLART
jgi:hypothetical protein